MSLIQLLFMGVLSVQSTVLTFNLECDSENAMWYYIGHISGCSVLSVVDIISTDIEITSVNDQNEPTEMKGLTFQSKTVNYVPKGINRFFPNLRGLAIVGSRLKSIKRTDLEGLRNIESLFLDNNQLESLEGDLFQSNTKILFLSISKNPLKQIGENILTPLVILIEVLFNDCSCINQRAKGEQIKSLALSLETSCPDLDVMRQKYPELNAKNAELMSENKKLKNELVTLTVSLETKFFFIYVLVVIAISVVLLLMIALYYLRKKNQPTKSPPSPLLSDHFPLS